MIDHLSYSQIDLFLKCPRKYYFQYVLHPDRREDSWAFALGRAYHLACEAFYRHQTYDSGIEDFMTEIKDWRLNQSKKFEAEQMLNNLKFYYNNIYPRYGNLVKEVEYKPEGLDKFYIEGIDVPIEMRIDLLTVDDKIIDHKTVGQSEPTSAYNKQLLLYAYWFYKKTGKLPRAVELHKSFKNPKGDPVVVESQSVNLPDVIKVVEQTVTVYNQIKQAMFNPSISKLCNYCSYKVECDNMSIRKS